MSSDPLDPLGLTPIQRLEGQAMAWIDVLATQTRNAFVTTPARELEYASRGCDVLRNGEVIGTMLEEDLAADAAVALNFYEGYEDR